MSDRLKDLQRQRALAQEELTRLDREIAKESLGTKPIPPPPTPGSPAVPVRRAQSTKVPFADDIIAQYQTPGRSAQDEAKRGCLLYICAAFVLLCLVLVAVWFFKYR